MNRNSILRMALLAVFACGIFINSASAQTESCRKTLSQKYPKAKYVEWEMENGYMTAEFLDEYNQEVEMCFDTQGNWVRTKTDLFFRNLPDVVKKAYQNSPYAQWRVDDIDFVEQPKAESIYIIEVEKGEQEYKLFISEKGEIK